ncbi:MAG: DUF3693 domain-containing protein [Candidatus Paceibacterota bacterium]
MKSTINYVDAAKEKLGIESDYGIAKVLDVNRATVSLWRNGKGSMDDYAAAKIAVILGVDPMEVIASANAEREKTDERKEFWQDFYKRLGGIAATIFFAVNLIMTPTPSQAAPMLNAEVPHCILC